MKIKKFWIALLTIFIILLSGCGGDSSPRALWNRYIKAMNSMDLANVAAIYFIEGSTDYNLFMEQDPYAYFSFGYVETLEFNTELANDKYYCADVMIEIDGDVKQFYVYFVKNTANQWKFISEVNITSGNPSELGNQPDANYYSNIVKQDETFKYKYIYGRTAGVKDPSDYIKIVEPLKNQKVVEIPAEIEGVPVKAIGDYAFFHYRKILSSFTRPTSKMEQLILPDTLEKIEEYAFYQSVRLKTLELPASLIQVGNYAFAGCTGLTQLTINVNESDMYGSLTPVVGVDSMYITGDAKIYVDDVIPYQTTASVNWSVSDEAIATITENGQLTALSAGTVTITATNKADGTKRSWATVTVQPKPAEDQSKNTAVEPLAVEYSYTPIIIEGATNQMYAGDYAVFSVDNYSVGDIIWESNNANLKILQQYDGKVLAVSKTDAAVVVTARSTSDPHIYGTVSFIIRDASVKLTFSENSLDRLNSLKAIYLNAINPNSVAFKGTLKLNSNVKIYVPARSVEAYRNSEVWKSMKDNFYPMETE